jgi:hypothetical protein
MSTTLKVEVNERVLARLRVLGEPEDVLARLLDHAQQGVYRPSSWERYWLSQVFGSDFLSRLEPDPEAHGYMRPKGGGKGVDTR